ncbi:hypothetical protein OG901_26645 [Streptomyces mirabilis]|uniref:hypothetical protein n=1 Tax=Streptomyces mirabilis TaxID=68239 RepID=UPI0022501B7D|nr:hypothetical protein [Streptomyces mirabilis]MCX5351289.1 hypothetical protein [Streptomyces mirabilis]
MDLDALRHGNFSQLGEAITDWEEMTKKLATLKEDAQNNLKAKADKASWAGINAQVSREFIDKTAREFTDAHTQADSITKILKDTHGELVDYRTQLTEAIGRGEKKNLTVIDTRHGTFTVTGNTRPDWTSDPSGKQSANNQKDADDLRNEIQRILSKATESDNSAAKVLKLLVDQTKYGFSDGHYTDRDSAADAVEAADKLAKMAKHPDKMSSKDIAEFNRYLGKYHNDPLFSEQFAKGLGGKGTLQFWTDMVNAHAGARGTELESLKNLQTNLSMTLATASFSDSDDMRAWKTDLLKETNTSFLSDSKTPFQNPVGALGSQVLSSLMRQGEFDTEFLDDYRTKLFRQDKGAGDSNTDSLWVKGYDHIDLIFGEENGRDPLEGLFDALSHNPEAATHAFESKSDLNHMLGTTVYTDRGESLGRALESAVTGVAAGDTTSMAPPHSADQVKIMANIMHAVAQPDGGADLVTKGLGESFGDMAASYMPEISQAFAGADPGAVFLTNSDDPKGLALPAVTRFLSATSADPAGRAGIIYGESIYTGNLLEEHLSNPSLFHGERDQLFGDIGRNAGIIEGIVGHSAANAEVSGAVNGEKDYNDALKAKGDFAKTWVAVGLTFAQVPERLGGAAMGAVVGGGAGAVASAAVDRLLEGQQLEGAKDEALYHSSQDLFRMRDSVSQQTQWSVEDALARHHVDLPEDGIKDTVRQAVNDGWEDSDYYLNRSKEHYE